MSAIFFLKCSTNPKVDKLQLLQSILTEANKYILQFDVVVDVTRFIMESLQCFNHLNTNLAYSVQSKRRLKFLKVVF